MSGNRSRDFDSAIADSAQSISPESKLPIRVRIDADDGYRAPGQVGPRPSRLRKYGPEFGKNPPPGEPKICLAVVLTDLGLLLEDKGDFDAALPTSGAASSSKSGKKNWEANMRRRATSLGYVALVLWDRGDYAAAQHKFEETLAVGRELLPAKDPQIAVTLTYLGNLLAAMGDQKSARPYIEEGLNIHKEVSGPNHRDTATSLKQWPAYCNAKAIIRPQRHTISSRLKFARKAIKHQRPHCGQIVEQFRGIVPRHWRLLVGPQLLRPSAWPFANKRWD